MTATDEAAFDLRSRFVVDDDAVSRLHDRAFGQPGPVLPWSERLQRHSVAWVGAFHGQVLIGFVHAVWDGGMHAFLVDTAVHPAWQRRGVGVALVGRLIEDVRCAGCEWLHVDYKPGLRSFYETACGFDQTNAGLVHISAG